MSGGAHQDSPPTAAIIAARISASPERVEPVDRLDARPRRRPPSPRAECPGKLLGDHGRPGLAAGAVSMARILDNPLAVSTQPAACRQLMAVLDVLHTAAVPRHGRLAVIQEMSTRPDAG